MMGYRIREIETTDFKELIKLFQEFAVFEKFPHKMTNSVRQMETETEFIKGFVVIDANNRMIGYATYFYTYYTWIGKSMYMDDLYVKPEFRGKGIGSELIGRVIERAKEDKCKKLRWQVSKWNKPAIEFYKNLGANIDNVQLNCDLSLS